MAKQIKRPRRSGAGPSAEGPGDGGRLAGIRSILEPLVAEVARLRGALMIEAGPANVHALRGALRRTRAAIALFAAAPVPGDAAWVQRELKWLTRKFGATRDLDVLAERLVKPKRAYSSRAGDDHILLGAAERARASAAAIALAAAASARATFVVSGLGAWIQQLSQAALNPALPDPSGSSVALSRDDAKIRRRGAHIEKLGPKARHKLRGRIRTLRYKAEALSQLNPRDQDQRYIGSLTALHQILGDMNDIDVGDRLAGKLSGTSPRSLRSDRGRHSGGARRRKLKAAWADFEAASKMGPPTSSGATGYA